MKRGWMFGLLLPMLLSGCIQSGADGNVQVPGVTDVDAERLTLEVAVAEQKAEYYQQLSAQLQEELLSVRADWYERCLTYEAQIKALEAQLQVGTSGSVTDQPTTDTVPSSEFQFRIADGQATLVAYIGDQAEVQIPAMADGYPVTAIADRAFENQIRLTSVTIPEGVLTIGWFSFSGCVALRSVTLPDSMESISYGAFLNCNSSVTMYCPSDSYAAQYARSYGFSVKES